MTTATSAGPFEAVYASLPTVAEGWTTPKAVAEVTAIGYSTVTRHLRALEEAGMAECSTDRDVTGVRGKVWRQRAARPRVVGGIETVELPAGDVEPDPVQRYVDAAERGVFDEIREADPAGVSTVRVEVGVGADGCGCPITAEMTTVDGEPRGDVEGTERTEHRDGCWNAEPIAMLADDGEGDGPIPGCACEECEEIAEAAQAPAGPHGVADYHQPLTDFERRAGVVDPTAPLVDDEDGDPAPVSPAPTGGDVAAIADWMAGQRTVDPLSAQDARALTDRIRLQVTELLPLIKEAYSRRADLALGYDSWSEYCDAELRGLRMPLAERQTATAELAAEGMSTRAIAGAIGSSEATVRRDLAAAGAPDDAPERVTGLDGRSYPARKPKTAVDGVTDPPAADGAEGALITPGDTPAGDGSAGLAAVPGNPSAGVPSALRIRAHAWSIMQRAGGAKFGPGGPEVWIASARKGIDYHRPVGAPTLASALSTGCARSMRSGERLPLYEAEERYDATPCPRCWPEPADLSTEPAEPLEVDADAPTAVAPSTSDATDSQAGDIAAEGTTGDDVRADRPGPQPALVGELLPSTRRPQPNAERVAVVADALRELTVAIDVLQEIFRDDVSGPSLTLPDLKHERRRLDKLIGHLQQTSA